jgi:hypothetical protein
VKVGASSVSPVVDFNYLHDLLHRQFCIAGHSRKENSDGGSFDAKSLDHSLITQGSVLI